MSKILLKKLFSFIIFSSLIIFLLSINLIAQTATVRPGPHQEITLALVGDAIITHRISQFDNPLYPQFQRMVSIIRNADAAFLNLELSLICFSDFKGWPEVENGGNWEVGPPECGFDLKEMGFDLMSRANNHTTDYGVEGMKVTDALLDRLGIVHAGSGMNLGQASRPGYLSTIKERVALISFASSFTRMSRAGACRQDMVGRPGLNALRLKRVFQVDSKIYKMLAQMAPKLGGKPAPKPSSSSLTIFAAESPGSRIIVVPGKEYKVVETPYSEDQERILRQVANASRLADYVIVASHSHQPGNKHVRPPDWLKVFAKQCIDAGASAFIVTGPHQLRGIEIYKGKPIFYSLGNFIFQQETIDPVPADFYEKLHLSDTALAADLYDKRYRGGTIGFPSSPIWYESIIAVPTFKDRKLINLKLYPIDLGQKEPRSQRGSPFLADEAKASKIIKHLAELSAPFGTKIDFKNGIGIWIKASS
jgi:poly-gamma-glutamate capsule biosynthesis protein CapA/YwtB (metallophosphatase superfamily)